MAEMTMDDVRRVVSESLNSSLIDGVKFEKALRRGIRLAMEEHAASGDIAAKHLLALDDLDKLKVERDALKAENATLKARGP